jgi:hypothetical protein
METKSFLTSVSFWGVVLTALNFGLAKLGYHLDVGATAQALVDAVGPVVTLIGVLRRKDIHVIPQ